MIIQEDPNAKQIVLDDSLPTTNTTEKYSLRETATNASKSKQGQSTSNKKALLENTEAGKSKQKSGPKTTPSKTNISISPVANQTAENDKADDDVIQDFLFFDIENELNDELSVKDMLDLSDKGEFPKKLFLIGIIILKLYKLI